MGRTGTPSEPPAPRRGWAAPSRRRGWHRGSAWGPSTYRAEAIYEGTRKPAFSLLAKSLPSAFGHALAEGWRRARVPARGWVPVPPARRWWRGRVRVPAAVPRVGCDTRAGHACAAACQTRDAERSRARHRGAAVTGVCGDRAHPSVRDPRR